MKKARLGRAIGMGVGILVLAGCSTLTPDTVPETSEETALKRDVKALQEWRQEVRLAQEDQARDIEALRKQVRDLEAAFREQQQAVKVLIQDLETNREKDKAFILEELSRKLVAMQGALAPPPAAGPKSGYEHVVKSGETLSVIAKGYQKDMSAILKANNLKDANSIKVGQKLFIPD